MTPEQKDTIREEWDKLQMRGYDQLEGEAFGVCSDNTIWDRNDIEDWWLQKLEEAYQQGYNSGSKDSLNRVKNAKTTLVNPDFPVVVNIIVDTVARGMNINLKDNT